MTHAPAVENSSVPASMRSLAPAPDVPIDHLIEMQPSPRSVDDLLRSAEDELRAATEGFTAAELDQVRAAATEAAFEARTRLEASR